jgi:hypothetical protein
MPTARAKRLRNGQFLATMVLSNRNGLPGWVRRLLCVATRQHGNRFADHEVVGERTPPVDLNLIFRRTHRLCLTVFADSRFGKPFTRLPFSMHQSTGLDFSIIARSLAKDRS